MNNFKKYTVTVYETQGGSPHIYHVFASDLQGHSGKRIFSSIVNVDTLKEQWIGPDKAAAEYLELENWARRWHPKLFSLEVKKL